MTRNDKIMKRPESETVETAETAKPMETTETTETGTGISVDMIEETQAEIMTPVIMEGEEADGAKQATSGAEQIETTAEDCETLYGVIMETAHGMVGKKKGKGHRGLPEARRKAQGKLLHSICQKYGITIPTEFELVIFGGTLIADWQYMTVDEDEYAVSAAKTETPPITEDEPE